MRKFLVLLLLLIISCAPKEEKKGKDWTVYYDLGMSSYYAKNYSEAVANFHRALQVNPNEPKIWNALGLTYTEVKEYDKAVKAFKKALELDPKYTEAKMNLGILYMRMKKYRLAIKYLKEAVKDEFFDKKHIAFFYLAKVYNQLGDKAEYVRYLEKAVNYNPMYIEAQIELAQAYEELGEYKKAEDIYKNLIENNLGNSFILYKLAQVYYKQGKINEAKKIVRKLLFEEKLTEDQREMVKKLLSDILIAEHVKLLEEELEKEKPKKEEKKKEIVKEEEKFYAVQVAAFSSLERAENFVKKLNELGLNYFRIQEVDGVFKVLYGKFKTKEEAYKAKEMLKNYNIYGFVVEVK